MMRIKKNEQYKIISGKDKGKKAVIDILSKKGKVSKVNSRSWYCCAACKST